ncbi:DUF1801 domain-containing protein [Flavobacterium pallidum]|uniref:YdhG-like domain-containing protein n=1 Tax=Flavobacterium pallidum TaxID=2172098 RepID=A0A2S1SJS0_9FLAO|nr:DUF1801 domain-containing protein [Flavobacterium pallidum]AWI26625.1 hypothetical protein HYN49_12360 [Flavobacterium pallidum]
MQSKATTVEQYLEELPEERKSAIGKLRATVRENLPDGFSEGIAYGMITYCVPHSIYPDGYHCNPKLPLPFMSIASQKNFIALHHIGIYANQKLLDWFVGEYPKHSKWKLDMGKGCIRFKKPEAIPFELIAELSRKISVQDWISIYENNLKR